MNERGKFFVFEGIGGAGKTTQVELAGKYLESIGRIPRLTREPGGVTPSEVIRRLIFRLVKEKVANPDHQIALFFAARDFWVREFVAANIGVGQDVLSDRSYPSTVAYQGYGEGADLKGIDKWVDIVMGEYKPDAIILLDVGVDTAKTRVDADDDPYDSKDGEWFERVIEGYRTMARQNWSNVPWFAVDGEQTIAKVSEEVNQVLSEIITRKVLR